MICFQHPDPALEEEYRVLPGHGEDSLLSYEKRGNPYMQGA